MTIAAACALAEGFFQRESFDRQADGFGLGIALYPCITILIAWVYDRTNGSIMAAAIFHASMNPLMGIFPITTAGNILLVSLALVAVVSDRMWRRLPADHPAVYKEHMPSVSTGLAV